MAVDATCFQILLIERAAVTGAALSVGVAMSQREARLRFVVEDRTRPTLWRVAARTITAEMAAVYIVGGVAGAAIGRRVLVAITRVTKPTIDANVRSLECEPGRRVLELGLPPAALEMASRTVIAQATAMRVVFPVTVGALLGRLAIRLLGDVTGRARHLAVPAPKFEVGKAVLEGLSVETEDVGITSLVLAVAVAAERPLHARIAPVQTTFALNILGDLFVATQAPLPLLSALEGLVTRSAVPLDFCVDLRDWAGYHQLPEVDGRGVAGHRQDRQAHNSCDSPRSHVINRRAPPGRERVLQ
jgi:hypothetical protein